MEDWTGTLVWYNDGLALGHRKKWRCGPDQQVKTGGIVPSPKQRLRIQDEHKQSEEADTQENTKTQPSVQGL